VDSEGAADEAVLNKVRKKSKKSPVKNYEKIFFIIKIKYV
jgi:hypothetical protein